MDASRTPAGLSSASSHNFESPASVQIGSSILRNLPEIRNSEGFQFSFNETSKEDCKGSWEPSPSPKCDKELNSFTITDELDCMQRQIRAINLKLHKNIEILKDKERKNDYLKEILQKHELKSTMPTDTSFLDRRCSCNDICILQ